MPSSQAHIFDSTRAPASNQMVSPPPGQVIPISHFRKPAQRGAPLINYRRKENPNRDQKLYYSRNRDEPSEPVSPDGINGNINIILCDGAKFSLFLCKYQKSFRIAKYDGTHILKTDVLNIRINTFIDAITGSGTELAGQINSGLDKFDIGTAARRIF